MPIKILMPALSPTMQEGNLVKWFKNEGDMINPGEVIAEIETDKATMEVDAVDSGILAKILIPAGTQNVQIGSLIAVILEEGEDKANLEEFCSKHNQQPKIIEASQSTPNAAKIESPNIVNNKTTSADMQTLQVSHTVGEVRTISNGNGRIFASPLAKRLASEQGINLSQIKGTGPNGRIVKADIESFHSNDASTSRNLDLNNHPYEPYKDQPNSNIRSIIAKRLVESKQNVPHFYLTIECNVDKLLDARHDVNKHSNNKISVNDLIILATAKALRKVPEANVSWHNTFMRFYNHVDISVAVAIEGGLITPIIKDADKKSIFQISNEMKSLIKKARENKLKPEEFQGGNFSISNLGMYGIKNFNAIINPPQSCILAVGSSVKKPIVIDDQIKIASIMEVTLSCDHRAVDGAVGSWFLNAFKEFIENPLLMLIQS